MLLVCELQSTVRQVEINNSVNRVWNEILLEYQEQYPDGIPTDVFVKVFSEKMAKEFLPYIRETSNRKREKQEK